MAQNDLQSAKILLQVSDTDTPKIEIEGDGGTIMSLLIYTFTQSEEFYKMVRATVSVYDKHKEHIDKMAEDSIIKSETSKD